MQRNEIKLRPSRGEYKIQIIFIELQMWRENFDEALDIQKNLKLLFMMLPMENERKQFISIKHKHTFN